MDAFGGARPKKKQTKTNPRLDEVSTESSHQNANKVNSGKLEDKEVLNIPTGSTSTQTSPPFIQTGSTFTQTGSPSIQTSLIPAQTSSPFIQTGSTSTQTNLIPTQTGSASISVPDFKLMNRELLVIIQTPMKPCRNVCDCGKICGDRVNPHMSDFLSLENSLAVKSNENGKKFTKDINKSSHEKTSNVSVKEKWRQSGLALKNYVSEKLGFRSKKARKLDELSSPTKESSENSVAGYVPLNNDIVPEKLTRSRSLLKYLSHKKDKVSRNFMNGKLKKSSSLETSSSDRPISSSDFSSATSDWSSENALTNQCSHQVSSLANGLNCNTCKYTQGHNSKPVIQRSKRNDSQTVCKKYKCKKQCKKNSQLVNADHSTCNNSVKYKSDKTRKKDGLDVNVDRNQHTVDTDSDSTDCNPNGNHTQRNPKATRHRRSRNSSSLTARESDQTNESRPYLSESTLSVLSGLQYAIPYLPERFRNRLHSTSDTGLVESSSGSVSQSVSAVGSLPVRETTGSHITSRETTHGRFTRREDRIVKTRDKQDNQPDVNSRNLHQYRTDTQLNDSKAINAYIGSLSASIDRMDELVHLHGFESSLEDPFNVRNEGDKSNVLCSGLLDFVRTADSASNGDNFEITDDLFEHKPGTGLSQCPSTDSDLVDFNVYSTGISSSDDSNLFSKALLLAGSSDLMEQSDVMSHSNHGAENQSSVGFDSGSNQSTLTGFYDSSTMLDTAGNQSRLHVTDIDYPGYKALNDSFDRMLQDDDSSTSDSPFREHLLRSRSCESGLRSRSSDENIEADDEYECDCEHCQYLLTQHSITEDHVTMAAERYRQDRLDEAPYDLDVYPDTSVPEHETDQYSSWDIGLPFQPNIPLLLSGSPLGELLEDVIEHMLAARPELFLDEQYPPARKDVIDNLPTVSLTLTHIEQHPSCPICLCPSELEEIMTVLPCQHIFHPLCIQAWLTKSGTCPVCRRKIRSF